MNDQSLVQEWTDDLDAAASILSTVISKREDVFLEFGERLQQLSSNSRTLAVQAEELTSLTGGQDISLARQRLHADFQGIAGLCQAEWDEEDIGALKELRGVFDQLRENMRVFRRIVRTLGVLSFTTRLESSRLGESGHGFLTLADDVEKLGRKIIDNWRQIGERTESLQDTVSSAEDKITVLVRRQKQALEMMLSGMTKNLGRLERLQEQSRIAASVFERKIADIRESIAQAVSSIQFHDITRQSLEHVQHMLEEARDQISGYLAGSENDLSESQLAGWVNKVCRLQESQIEHARNQFTTAVDEIGASLAEIGDGVRAMVDELDASLGTGDTRSKGVIWEIQSGIQEVETSMQSFAHEGKLIKEVMEEVRLTVSRMSSFAEHIEEIGSEIELIALNASVRAARTGAEGMALGVVAVAIQQLSGNARKQGLHVTSCLDMIAEQVRRLHRSSSHDDTGMDLGSLSGSMGESVELLRATDKLVTQGMEHIRAIFLDFSRTIDHVRERLSFKDLVVEELSMATTSLGRAINGSMELYSGEDQETLWPERLKALFERYTMESERMIYRNVLGEHHPEQEGEAATTATPDDQAEFGDNVELF